MKMDRDEIQWWIEDNKSKFYAICAIVVVVLLGIIFGIVSLLTPEPEPVIVEEDTYEEIEVGSFDVEGAIQEQEETEEERRDREYGLLYTLESGSYNWISEYGYGFVDVVSKEDGSKFHLLVNDGTFEDEAVSEVNWHHLMKDSDCYSCRGTFEDLDSKTIANWVDRDYKKVLDIFRDASFNKSTAKKWDELFIQCKVDKGYSQKEKIDNIPPKDVEDITNKTYVAFEDYLLSLEDVESGTMSPLTAYLEEHPLPTYENIKVVSTPLYLCKQDGEMWDKMNNQSVENYFNVYWSTYFATAEELFINEGDTVSLYEKEMVAGTPYKMTKQVNFSLQNDVADTELVLWYKTFDREIQYMYFPAIAWNIKEKQATDNLMVIPENAEYFGFYIIGETYQIDNTTRENVFIFENQAEEQKELSVQDTIRYKREDFCGNEYFVNVSEFIMLDGIYEIPTSKIYIKNDTSHTLYLYVEGDSSYYENFEPGAEVFFNSPELRTIKWKVLD